MWPVFSMQFKFDLLSNHTGGGELITLSIYQLLPNLIILKLV